MMPYGLRLHSSVLYGCAAGLFICRESAVKEALEISDGRWVILD